MSSNGKVWQAGSIASRTRVEAVSSAEPWMVHGRQAPLVLALWLAAAGPVHAVRARDMPPPTAESVRRAHASGYAADLGRAVQDGTLASVEAEGGRVVIDGVRYQLRPGHTRVYRQGQRVDSGQLSPGQRVGFAIAPHARGRDDVLELLLIHAGGDARDAR